MPCFLHKHSQDDDALRLSFTPDSGKIIKILSRKINNCFSSHAVRSHEKLFLIRHKLSQAPDCPYLPRISVAMYAKGRVACPESLAPAPVDLLNYTSANKQKCFLGHNAILLRRMVIYIFSQTLLSLRPHSISARTKLWKQTGLWIILNV